MEKIDVGDKLTRFNDHWSPKIVAELNGQHVKVVKYLGEFDWHKHDNEDELFYVVKGVLELQFRDRDIILSPGEMIVVPRGVEHRPVALEEVHCLLFEPAGTLNTGNVTTARTVDNPDWI